MTSSDEEKSLEATLARIDERTAWIQNTLNRHQECYEDHETRLRKLEESKNKKAGEAEGEKNGEK